MSFVKAVLMGKVDCVLCNCGKKLTIEPKNMIHPLSTSVKKYLCNSKLAVNFIVNICM
jgi:hypothetical protein